MFGDVGLPVRRTIAYVSSAATERRRSRFADLGIPVLEASVGLMSHVGTDEITLAAFRLLRSSPSMESWSRIADEVGAAVVLFEERGWTEDPRSYLGDPPPLANPTVSRLRSLGVNLELLTFPSGWEPRPSEPGADRWRSYGANRTARAHVLRHADGARPWVVCVHGTGMGRAETDLVVLDAQHLHRDLGCNVVMPVLALHGARRAPRESGARFPTVDVLDNVHGLAQSVWDVRRVLSWVRSQEPATIAVTGLSLGGYVAALAAGLEPPFASLIACVPAVDFPKMLRRHQPRSVRDRGDVRMIADKSEVLHRAVSPLLVTPATPVERRFILAGAADRLLDPVEQAGALWEHWQRPEVRWLATGHVSHLIRRQGRPFVDEALRRTGVTSHVEASPTGIEPNTGDQRLTPTSRGRNELPTAG